MKNKGGRPPNKPKQAVVISKIEPVPPPTIIQNDIEYKGHVIHTEPHGRVMVTKHGLHVTEFIDIEAKNSISLLIDKAKVYIDVSIR